MNNSILRDIFKDNAFIGEILRADHQTQDLLNYQIADIIDFSKIEADDFKLNFTEFNIRGLLEKLREIFEPMSIQKNLFFVMKIDENIPLTIFQDENRVGQILVNIISNAVKYTFNGQVSIIAESSYPLDEIKVIIKDSGKGIDKLSRVG